MTRRFRLLILISMQNELLRKKYEGSIMRIIYRNDDNGYTVAVLLLHKKPDDIPAHEIVITGYLPTVSENEHIRVQGTWVLHSRYGKQFQVERYEIIPPSTAKAIERYLASGAVQGIGKELAHRIVEHFGDEAIEILDNHPDRLLEVPGIGRKKLESITSSRSRDRALHDVILFFQEVGLGYAIAHRLYKKYGEETIQTIKGNPYRLAFEVERIGFKTADQIAERIGFPLDSPERARAALHYVLQLATADGNTCLTHEELITQTSKIVPEDLLPLALEDELKADRLIMDELDEPLIYLPQLFTAESRSAEYLAKLIVCPWSPSRLLSRDPELTVGLSQEQKKAMNKVLSSKVSVLTGGPGVGKTTVVRYLTHYLKDANLEVKLCAPTGRASKRLSELCSAPASTIHRLLQYQPHLDRFFYTDVNPLPTNAIIIDESSMVDIVLLYHLLKATPPDCMLVLVGDHDQLPPVGPGDPLRDIIRSGAVDVARLTEIFRQARDSLIIQNAHRINSGELPTFNNCEGSDFFFIEEGNPARVAELVRELCVRRLPQKYNFHPIHDIQVISPMYKGEAGVDNLNRILQNALNPSTKFIEHSNYHYAVGDKVMQTVNNYSKNVFNGDIGIVTRIYDDRTLRVNFDSVGEIDYQPSELDEIVPAYAISVHKSQGCEYPCVIICLLEQHYLLLHRNLFYTALTRAKSLAIIVGTKRAIQIAVQRASSRKRRTYLAQRLRNALA